MAISIQLQERSNHVCELCGSEDNNLKAYTIPPRVEDLAENQVVLCSACFEQVNTADYSDSNYWRCLQGSIWSEVPAVQVLSYKILGRLSAEEWARDTIESVYLDETLLDWANAEDMLEAEKVIHKDSYGVVLESGDTVVLIQNLNVKGTNYIAPKGTIVRKIKLVHDNAEQVEGKINGDTIVILTKYLKKSV